MANGRLAAVTPTENTDTLLYQVPASTTGSVAITVCNTNTSSSNIRISIENSSAVGIATTNCIEYDTTIAPYASFERGGLVLGNQQKLFCESSVSNVNFIVYGYEE
jgi:hypothetical protein